MILWAESCERGFVSIIERLIYGKGDIPASMRDIPRRRVSRFCENPFSVGGKWPAV